MGPRVALVHDFLLDLRGAERVFAAICDAWPEADVFSAVYDERGTEGRFAGRNVRTSFLQRLRPTARTFRVLLPLYPHAVESLDLRGYDVVISSSSAWSHGVLVDPGAVHVCYCHNPFRYAWSEREATLRARGPLRAPGARACCCSRWRQWDWIAAQRVDRYVANSAPDRQPRAPLSRPRGDRPAPAGGARALRAGARRRALPRASELMAHKRMDVAIRAFNALGLPLVVVGDGPEARRLARLAGPTVRFTGRLPDAAVAELLRSCRALVIPAAEEFGIAAVEALASGRPVMAAQGGGVLRERRGRRHRRVLRGRRRARADRLRARLRRAGGRSRDLRGGGAALRARALPGSVAADRRGRRGGGAPAARRASARGDGRAGQLQGRRSSIRSVP